MAGGGIPFFFPSCPAPGGKTRVTLAAAPLTVDGTQSGQTSRHTNRQTDQQTNRQIRQKTKPFRPDREWEPIGTSVAFQRQAVNRTQPPHLCFRLDAPIRADHDNKEAPTTARSSWRTRRLSRKGRHNPHRRRYTHTHRESEERPFLEESPGHQ